MSDTNEKSDQFETNSDSNSNTKICEEDGSPTDNENNMITDFNSEIINNGISDNYEIIEENINKSDSEVNINELAENDTDDDIDNDDNTYVKEIEHEYENVVFYNKKNKYENKEDNEEIGKLIEELNSLNLYDPKIDVLFKTIFKNEDLLLSLLNSIIPDEEHIDKIEYSSEEIIFFPFFTDGRNKIVVDLCCKELDENYINKKNNSTNDEEKYKKHIIIEMQIKKKGDIVIRANVSITSFYRKENLEFKSNIYTFDFLFYNYFDDDIYLHELNSNLPKKKDNKYQNKVYVSELRKFRKGLKMENLKKLSKKVEDNKSKGIVDRKLEKDLKKQLWFAFLSKINVIYKKNRKKLEKNTKNSEGGEEGKRKYKIYIRNDISPELYKLFKQDKDIMKAIGICKQKMNKEDADKYYRYITSEEEIADLKNKNTDLKNKNTDLENENAELRNQQKIQQDNFMKTQEHFTKTMKDKDHEIEKLNNEVNELRNQQKIQQDNFMKTQENFMKTMQENFMKTMQENFMKTMQENFMKTMQENFMKMMKDKDNEIENLKNELKRYRKDPEFNEKEVSKKKKLI